MELRALPHNEKAGRPHTVLCVYPAKRLGQQYLLLGKGEENRLAQFEGFCVFVLLFSGGLGGSPADANSSPHLLAGPV
jgi:hypothetical protein